MMHAILHWLMGKLGSRSWQPATPSRAASLLLSLVEDAATNLPCGGEVAYDGARARATVIRQFGADGARDVCAAFGELLADTTLLGRADAPREYGVRVPLRPTRAEKAAPWGPVRTRCAKVWRSGEEVVITLAAERVGEGG